MELFLVIIRPYTEIDAISSFISPGIELLAWYWAGVVSARMLLPPTCKLQNPTPQGGGDTASTTRKPSHGLMSTRVKPICSHVHSNKLLLWSMPAMIPFPRLFLAGTAAVAPLTFP